jgi:hypothetical protein
VEETGFTTVTEINSCYLQLVSSGEERMEPSKVGRASWRKGLPGGVEARMWARRRDVSA